MSGRNWTRKSIEELVEAYLRGKKRPAPVAGNYIYIRDFRPLRIGTLGRNSYGRIDVGYISTTGETIQGGGTYYPKLTGGATNYIEMSNFTYKTGYSTWADGRYKVKSGSIVTEASYNGRLVDPANDREIEFTILTVPKEFNIINLASNCRIACDGLPYDATYGTPAQLGRGKLAIVTSDPYNNPNNTQAVKVNRTMYIPASPDQGNMWSNAGIFPNLKMKSNAASGNAYYRCELDEGNEYRYVDPNDGFYYNQPTDIDSSGYDTHSIYSGGKFGYVTIGSPNTSLATFINAVKNAYDGTLEYSDSSVRNLNFMTLIFVNCEDTELEQFAYILSRWFVDAAHYDAFVLDPINIKLYQQLGANFGADENYYALCPAAGVVGNSVVKYNKVII